MTDVAAMPRIGELDTKFREPKTPAEMIPARLALIEALGEQLCSQCRKPLVARDPRTQSYEQLWCGLNFDCPNSECSVVCQSWDGPELAHYHGRPYSPDGGKTWQKYAGGAWVEVTEQEAATFWVQLTAWHESRGCGSSPGQRRKAAAWKCRKCGRRAEYREGWHHLTTVAGIEADSHHQAEPTQAN